MFIGYGGYDKMSKSTKNESESGKDVFGSFRLHVP